MTIQNRILMGILFFIFLGGKTFADITPRTYWMEAVIEPEEGTLKVEGELLLSQIPKEQDTIFFNLHSSFKIEKIRIEERKAPFTAELNSRTRTVPASKMILVRVPDGIDRKNPVMRFRYQGALQDISPWGSQENQRYGLDDTISPERVELASYSNWYPFWYYGVHFDFELKVSLPEEWVVVCNGEKRNQEKAEGRSVTTWAGTRANDMVILASPDFKKESIAEAGTLIHSWLDSSGSLPLKK